MPKITLPTGDLLLRAALPEEAHLVLGAIAKSPVFCTLPPAKYAKLLPFFGLATVHGATTIVRKGERPGALFMIVAGAVRVGPGRHGPGHTFGAISPDAEPCDATVRTVEDATLAVLLPVQLKVLARAIPELRMEEDE